MKQISISLMILIGLLLKYCLTASTSSITYDDTQQRIVCAAYSNVEQKDFTDTADYADIGEDDDENSSSSSSSDDSEVIINVQTIDTNDNGIMYCSNQNEFCYAVWRIDELNNIQITRQGCLQMDAKQQECSVNACINSKSISSNYKYCCCKGNMCNLNMTDMEPIDEIKKTDDVIASSSSSSSTENRSSTRSSMFMEFPFLWILTAIFLSLIFILITAFMYHLKQQRNILKLEQQTLEHDNHHHQGPGYSSNLYNVDNLTVCAIIGQGKFGTVWQGLLNEKNVAVKIFPSQHRQYFLNEKEIYSLPLMNNETACLLQYYGCDQRHTLENTIEYLLVLELAPLGCLQDWLKENTVSFSGFCKMAKSIGRGVSYLHTELTDGELIKPCVCHRDLNTRNILVKADQTCVISDLGFALKVYGTRYEWRGEKRVAETKSISDVGTLRYMSPEALEGAVNLRDCETSLKQMDVYSMGLILWELCVRCHDWYPTGQHPPEYQAPYEAEIGQHPTYEQMQVLISKRKVRPLFPANWGGGPAAAIAKETCEDCWDHDGEARLTALCFEERIHELSNLRYRSQFNSNNHMQGKRSPSSLNTINELQSEFISSPVHINNNNNNNNNPSIPTKIMTFGDDTIQITSIPSSITNAQHNYLSNNGNNITNVITPPNRSIKNNNCNGIIPIPLASTSTSTSTSLLLFKPTPSETSSVSTSSSSSSSSGSSSPGNTPMATVLIGGAITLKNQQYYNQQMEQSNQGRINSCQERNFLNQSLIRSSNNNHYNNNNNHNKHQQIDKSNKSTFLQKTNEKNRLNDDIINVDNLIVNSSTSTHYSLFNELQRQQQLAETSSALSSTTSPTTTTTHNNNHNNINKNPILMGLGFSKQNNIDRKLKGWYGVRDLIEKKLFKRHPYRLQDLSEHHHNNPNNSNTNNTNDNHNECDKIEEKSNLVSNDKINRYDHTNENHNNNNHNKKTEIPNNNNEKQHLTNGYSTKKITVATQRPNNLNLDLNHNKPQPQYRKSQQFYHTNDLQKQTITSANNNTKQNSIPSPNNQRPSLNFHHSNNNHHSLLSSAPAAETTTAIASSSNSIEFVENLKFYNPKIVISRSANAVKNLNNFEQTIIDEKHLKRQRSLEIFREVFGTKGSTERLRNPSERVKTPGDVPPSVRKIRASKTLSLYDDRMMDTSNGNTL